MQLCQYSLLTTHYLPLITHSSPLATCHFLPTAQHLPSSTHHLLLLLTGSAAEAAWFRILPRLRVHSEGERVRAHTTQPDTKPTPTPTQPTPPQSHPTPPHPGPGWRPRHARVARVDPSEACCQRGQREGLEARRTCHQGRVDVQGTPTTPEYLILCHVTFSHVASPSLVLASHVIFCCVLLSCQTCDSIASSRIVSYRI